ncbi:MAG: flippase-like domain-containing protein [Candidatus Iainarchaeum archaeon]|uniref:Flippase-like domain-containing protein n=1 Tax=Candidatus Iainarchaeum sp. TaxID=3101447 RepID=A0A7T9I2A5_9ARCH|nr:MAG: flippase-like domain-containing protein [Candidatus Diapherotrites archaeon]
MMERAPKLMAAVSLLLVIIITLWVGPATIFHQLSLIGAGTLTQVFVLSIFIILLNALAVWCLLKIFGPTPFLKYLQYYFASWSLGSLFPARIGDFSLAMFHRQLGTTHKKIILAVFADKLITLILVLVLVGVGLQELLVITPGLTSILWVSTGITIGIIVFLVALFLSPHIQDIVKKFLPERFAHALGELGENSVQLARNSEMLLANLIIALARLLLQGLIVWLLLAAQGVSISLLITTMLIAFASLSVFVPFTLGGVGVRESFIIVLFGLIGVSASTIAVSAFVQLIFHYLLVVILGVFFGKQFIKKNS